MLQASRTLGSRFRLCPPPIWSVNRFNINPVVQCCTRYDYRGSDCKILCAQLTALGHANYLCIHSLAEVIITAKGTTTSVGWLTSFMQLQDISLVQARRCIWVSSVGSAGLVALRMQMHSLICGAMSDRRYQLQLNPTAPKVKHLFFVLFINTKIKLCIVFAPSQNSPKVLKQQVSALRTLCLD